tara:strand:- start:60 stop:323 length:264 start_codon:yes stop_codon:yes gene_type:complete
MSNPNQVVVSQVSDVTIVEITTQGPQGIQGPQGAAGGSGGSGGALGGVNTDFTGKVNDSILYYHASSDTLKLDNTTTKLTLVDGGNF